MIKKILSITAISIGIMLFATPEQAAAQWSLGASYEVQNETPENGFGVRTERSILGQLPIIDLRMRAHFSYFSDDIGDDIRDDHNFPTSSDEIENYDFGLAAIGGVSVGLIKPYVGLGLGSQTVELSGNDVEDFNDGGNIFWNALVGAEVSPIPMLKPFIEYRFESFDAFEDAEGLEYDSSKGRMVFGVSLFF